MKHCVLQADKICNDCGACDERCELDPSKICDNCFRCLDGDDRAFAQIPIAGVYLGDDFVPDLYDDWTEEPVVEPKTLPMTYGARVRRSHIKR